MTLLIGCFGIIILYSAVASGGTFPQKTLFVKQLFWYTAGLMVMIASFLINYRYLEKWAHMVYGISIFFLVAVLIFGKQIGGSRRWLVFGPVSFQPSELAKVAVIVVMARYYSKRVSNEGFTWQELLTPFILMLLPVLLIVNQPDLGTAILIVLISGTLMLFAKIERRSLLFIALLSCAAVPMVWFFLKEYQKQRILTFLNPDRDPLGAGYHIIQSKIAIGSGMVGGKGFLKGTQNALSFLPEHHTDFIFSVLAEEWGFVGSMVVLFIFLFIIFRGLHIAYRCRDSFGTLLSLGITAIIFWQVFINVGMAMGLMPVVGVTLPFVSYGGSSLVTNMLCVGILINVSMRRFMFEP